MSVIDYKTKAHSRLTGQFSDKQRICGLVENMVEPLEALQEDFFALKDRRWVDSADGSQLDYCGYLVGISRQGRKDEEYRTAIKARILSNVSGATPSALIEGVRFLTNAKQPQYLESFPACAILFSDGETVPKGSQQVIQDIAPAAIENIPLLVSYGRTPPVRTATLTMGAAMSVSFAGATPHPLSVSEAVLSVGAGQPIGGTGLTGAVVTKTKIIAQKRGIRAGKGALTVGTYQIFDNGYHLTGVFQ
jgi:hypothetical protein